MYWYGCAVCSYSTYNQQIQLGYKTLEEINEYAGRYNVNNQNKWEERISTYYLRVYFKNSYST